MDGDTRNGMDGLAVGVFTLACRRPWVPHTPGFPVGLGGITEVHAAFLTESRTLGHGGSRVQEIRV
jgi:hypothetical protein